MADTTLADLEEMKRETLKDLIRRVIANPDRMDEVVLALAQDWYPKFAVSPRGNFKIQMPLSNLRKGDANV